MAYIVAHGLKLANNSFIENLVVDVVSIDYASSELVEGKMWYNSTESLYKTVKKDQYGILYIDTIASQTDLDNIKIEFAEQEVGISGATLVGFEGTTTTNGNMDIEADSVDSVLKLIAQAIDTEVKAREDMGSLGTDAIEAEVARATAAEATLTTNLSAEVTRATTAETTLTTNLTAEVTRAQGAEATLQSNLDSETSRAEAAEGTLQDNIDAEAEARTQADTDAKTYLDTNFLNKTTGADQSVAGKVSFAKDVVITGNFTVNGTQTIINSTDLSIEDNKIVLSKGTVGAPSQNAGIQIDRGTEGLFDLIMIDEADDKVKISVWDGTQWNLEQVVTAASFEDNTQALWDAINAEISSRTTGDSTLTTALNAEVTRATAAEGVLTTDLANEVARAEGSETDLQNAIDDELARATTAEGVLTADLASEVSRAKGVEGTLSSLTTTAKTNLVSAINEVKAATGSGSDALDAEIARATAAENDLQSQLNQEITSRTTGDSTLTTALNAEVTRATNAEQALSSSISNEANARALADGTLDNLTTDDKTDLVSAINEVDAHVDTEVARAMLAESTITTALNAEVTRATGVEGTLTSLTTTDKATLVAAINEVKGDVNTINAKVFTYESSVAMSTHTVTHNLNSPFITVQVWVEDTPGVFKNDLCAVTQSTNNELSLSLTESKNIRAIVTKA
jgi:hypothetical protein